MKNLQQAVIDLHAIASTLPQDNDLNTKLRKIADELHEYVNADLQTRHQIVTRKRYTDVLATHQEQEQWVKDVRRTEY